MLAKPFYNFRLHTIKSEVRIYFHILGSSHNKRLAVQFKFVRWIENASSIGKQSLFYWAAHPWLQFFFSCFVRWMSLNPIECKFYLQSSFDGHAGWMEEDNLYKKTHRSPQLSSRNVGCILGTAFRCPVLK